MRTKKSLIIFLTDVVPLVLVSIIGIFKSKVFLSSLGDETLGLYQLFSQIMTYIGLVDGGLSNAVLYVLYKPNVNKDNKELYSILVAARRTFAIIGATIFTLSFLVSFFVPYFIKESSFENSYISITFLLFALANIFSYFCVPEQVLLEVKEEKHIVNLSTQIGQIVQGILEIILLLQGFSFIDVLFLHVIVKFLSSFVIYMIAHKKYKNPYKKIKGDYCFLPQVKHLMFHKINGLVGSNIDVLITSKLLGLDMVAIYSVYNYISNMLNTIVGKFATSITAIVGNYMEEDNKKAYNIFCEFNNLMFYIAIVVCTTLIFAFNGFIDIWYEGEIATSMANSIAFSLLLFINIIIQPVCTFVNSAGLFKQTKICAATDTIVNLVLSLSLIHFYGISGIVIATVLSMFIGQFLMKGKVAFDNVFKEDFIKFLLSCLRFIIIFIIDVLIGYIVFKNVNITNIFIWFIVFAIYFVLNAVFVLILFKLNGSDNFLDRIKKIVKHKKIA